MKILWGMYIRLADVILLDITRGARESDSKTRYMHCNPIIDKNLPTFDRIPELFIQKDDFFLTFWIEFLSGLIKMM